MGADVCGAPLDWLLAVIATETDECLDWPYSTDARGRARLTYDGKLMTAAHAALLLAGQLRPPAPAHLCLRTCGNRRCVNPRHLRWGTEADRLTLRTTTNERETTMRLIRRKDATTSTPMTAREIEAERLRLADKVLGHGHALRSLFADDAVMVERLDRALAQGWECELADVPRHRRAMHAEESLDRWEALTRSGPCDWCGCVLARRGRVWAQALVPEVDPTWSVVAGRPACGWCADMIAEYGEAGLRGHVFRAAASIRSATLPEQGWELEPFAPFWHELPEAKRQAARRAGNGPWAHVPVQDCRDLAARGNLALPPSAFARTVGAVQHASIPGITSREWTPDELPRPGAPRHAVVGHDWSLNRQAAESAAKSKRRRPASGAGGFTVAG